MKALDTVSLLSLLSTAVAHSWLGCTDHDNKDILQWMKSNATEYPNRKDKIVDPLMPWHAHFCHGWPRAKQNPGFWEDESSNYMWQISRALEKGDTNACHPAQRSPRYHTTPTIPNAPHHSAPAPMATSTPGGSIKLMYGGNGHSRGYNTGPNNDPGRVAVYWAGAPETEITDLKSLTTEYLVQEQGFSEEAFMFPDDVGVIIPEQGLVDKGNWMTLRLPECMEQGRHMMVWVWEWGGEPRFTTCFDVMIN